MADYMNTRRRQTAVTDFLLLENNAANIHKLVNVYGKYTVDVSTVGWGVSRAKGNPREKGYNDLSDRQRLWQASCCYHLE